MDRSPSTVLYSSDTATVGSWRCAPDDEAFPCGFMERATVVFPRTSVGIHQQGEQALIADPNTAVLYRSNTEYERSAIDPVGDRCEWFEFTPVVMDEASKSYARQGDLTSPANHVPTSPRVYLTQRGVLRAIQQSSNAMIVEERLSALAAMVMAAAFGCDAGQLPVREEHRDLVNDAKEHMSRHFGSALSLNDIGREVGASSFHLARVFRSVTGQTLHRYLTDLRLRAALNLLDETPWGIAEVALEVGFGSHSHLTNSFGRRFGLTPSEYRRGGELSETLTPIT